MIDIGHYINTDSVIPELKAHTKEEAIKELLDNIFKNKKCGAYPLSKEEVYNAVLDREKLQTTGIGNDLAFPHARIDGWGDFAMAMGVSKNGIDFKSLDGKPAKLIFLMVSSTKEPYSILQIMSAIVQFLNDMGYDEQSQTSHDIPSILEKLLKINIKTSFRITAKDIARPVENFVTLEIPIEEVTRTMFMKRVSILPVVNGNSRLCGEISCYSIFDFGMPDFFKQLNTISFLRNIDPFEKYFKLKKGLKVKDIANLHVSPISEDSTLSEIIFEMVVKKKSKLFVVNKDGTLTGIIDRFSVIDKILFF